MGRPGARAILAELALAELPQRVDDGPLMTWIPRVTPGHQEPRHLAPIVDLLTRAEHEQVHGLVSVPPRHAKSETVLHGLVWLMRRRPGLRVGYVGRSQTFVREKSRDAQRIALRAGSQRGDRWTFDDWSLGNGSRFQAAGILTGFTGLGFDVIVVDDPYSSRAEAESGLIQSRVVESYHGDIYTRQGNRPTSFIVVHTRWVPGDLIGVLARDPLYDEINLPAIDAEGRALWPEVWPVERFDPIRRASPYDWESQYQGRPQPRGQALFRGATLTSHCPPRGRVVVGLDLAYSSRRRSDWSVAVIVRDGVIIDVIRAQEPAEDFGRRLLSRVPAGASIRWTGSGVEQGSAGFLREMGLPIEFDTARVDKFTRALPAAAAWNRGELPVLEGQEWTADFLTEMRRFTGTGADQHDDQVDALVSAYELLQSSDAEIITMPQPSRRRRRVGQFY